MEHKLVYQSEFGHFYLNKPIIDWLYNNGRPKLKEFIEKSTKEGENLGLEGEDLVDYVERAIVWDFGIAGIHRHDPDLIRCVEELGLEVTDGLAIYILKGDRYRITELDDTGVEYVIEPGEETYIVIGENIDED